MDALVILARAADPSGAERVYRPYVFVGSGELAWSDEERSPIESALSGEHAYASAKYNT